jgi:hypothetical protein
MVIIWPVYMIISLKVQTDANWLQLANEAHAYNIRKLLAADNSRLCLLRNVEYEEILLLRR